MLSGNSDWRLRKCLTHCQITVLILGWRCIKKWIKNEWAVRVMHRDFYTEYNTLVLDDFLFIRGYLYIKWGISPWYGPSNNCGLLQINIIFHCYHVRKEWQALQFHFQCCIEFDRTWLHFIPLWEWMWCNYIFHARQGWNDVSLHHKYAHRY